MRVLVAEDEPTLSAQLCAALTDADYAVEDLLTGERWTWHGAKNYVALDPSVRVAHVFRVAR